MKQKKLIVLMFGIAAGLLMIGVVTLSNNNSNNEEKNIVTEEKVTYQAEYEQYTKQIEFVFQDNQAKSATITEKYEDRNLYTANVIMLAQDSRFTDFKEDGNVVTYTYTEEGFKDLLNKDKDTVTSVMELIGYKLSN